MRKMNFKLFCVVKSYITVTMINYVNNQTVNLKFAFKIQKNNS